MPIAHVAIKNQVAGTVDSPGGTAIRRDTTLAENKGKNSKDQVGIERFIES